jgi:hypothetical protein
MEKSMETKDKTKKIVSRKSTTQRDDITTRVSKEIVQKAHEKNLTPKQFINKLLIQSQSFATEEQRLALARLDKMESKYNEILNTNKELEKKIDVLTVLLNQLFERIGG